MLIWAWEWYCALEDRFVAGSPLIGSNELPSGESGWKFSRAWPLLMSVNKERVVNLGPLSFLRCSCCRRSPVQTSSVGAVFVVSLLWHHNRFQLPNLSHRIKWRREPCRKSGPEPGMSKHKQAFWHGKAPTGLCGLGGAGFSSCSSPTPTPHLVPEEHLLFWLHA